MGFFKEFREFAVKGSVIDLAVGVIIGAAFGTIIKSLVDDILMPPIGLLLGGGDFSTLMIVLRDSSPSGNFSTPAEAKAVGAVTINYGQFINHIVAFLIVALAIFFAIKQINRLKRQKTDVAANTKECPYCLEQIELRATRCKHCTTVLTPRQPTASAAAKK